MAGRLMAEITTGSFGLAGAIPGDPSVGWRLERGPVTFRADLRLKDDQFVVALQRGEVTLSRGDVLLVDYRHKKRYGIRRCKRTGHVLITVTAVREHRPASGRVWIPIKVTDRGGGIENEEQSECLSGQQAGGGLGPGIGVPR